MRSIALRAEPDLSMAQFQAIADLLCSRTGIALPPTKQPLVLSRLARRLRQLSLPDFGAYLALISGPDGAEECSRMISALTTNVTAFFRESHHFDMLRARVLPPLIARARDGGRVRLWSAGCSSGEEPYSMAMVLFDLCPEAADLDIRILASDIDPAILALARAGRYHADALSGLDPALRNRWLIDEPGGGARIDPTLAAPIRFRALNLAADWPIKGPFDAIFCRNVTIYFDRTVQERVWTGMARVLGPGGHLFIGHSERLSGPTASLLESVGFTAYQRPAAPGAQS